MAEIEEDHVEILVHITAPSRGVDDAAYRAYATAYLAFEPAKIHQYEEHTFDNELRTSSSSAQYPQSSREAIHSNNANPSSLQSLAASFRSISDNINSPPFYGLSANQPSDSDRFAPSSFGSAKPSRQQQSDIIPNSAPESTLVSLPAAVKPSLPKLFARQITTPSRSSNFWHPSSFDYVRHGFSTPTPIGGFTQQQMSSPQLPSLPRKRRQSEEPAEKQMNSEDIQTSEPTPIIFPFSSAPFPNPAEKQSTPYDLPPQKRQRLLEPAQSKTSAKVGALKAHKRQVVAKEEVPVTPIIPTNPNEVRPPPPKTSNSTNFHDIVTPALAEILQPGMAKSWRDDFAVRELRWMERGYWLVDYTTWNENVRVRSWEFIQAHIGRGRAGWGVSCIRFPEKNELRMYCWGGIVKHIYYLIHIFSERALKATGAKWIDGAGKVVVVVPPRKNDPPKKDNPPKKDDLPKKDA